MAERGGERDVVSGELVSYLLDDGEGLLAVG